MDTVRPPNIRAAQTVLPCADLHATLLFFTDRLGFRVDTIYPAEDPSEAVISGHGLHIRLQRGLVAAPGLLRLLCVDPDAVAGGAAELTAPNGTRIQLAPANPPLALTALRPSFVLSKMSGEASFVEGRAGMHYRDLIPDRQGGRFIASHIRIPRGGPVPDYVHFHRVAFQMIYCTKGWVRVVYEDQGPPFVLREGDCALQPPEIRHRVLESSPGLEVIEIASPANHQTFADHELSLPTPTVDRGRIFGGQRFVRHEATAAVWGPWRVDGFEARDLGIAAATHGVAEALVARPRTARSTNACLHDAELLFFFVLRGTATLHCDDRRQEPISEGDAVVIPAGSRHELNDCSDTLELLEVTIPPLLATR